MEIEHADYPHEPGTLWDCGGCMHWECTHDEGDEALWCVSYNHGES